MFGSSEENFFSACVRRLFPQKWFSFDEEVSLTAQNVYRVSKNCQFSHSRCTMTKITTTLLETNGNHDSGYAPSSMGDVLAANNPMTPPASPPQATIYANKSVHYNKATKNGSTSKKPLTPNASPKKDTFR